MSRKKAKQSFTMEDFDRSMAAYPSAATRRFWMSFRRLQGHRRRDGAVPRSRGCHSRVPPSAERKGQLGHIDRG